MRALRRAGGTLKLMVYHRRSWKVFWIIVAQGHGPLLEGGGARRDAFRGADRLPGDLQLHAPTRREFVERAGFQVTDVVSTTSSRTGSPTTSSIAT